jgi:hypothetical protein
VTITPSVNGRNDGTGTVAGQSGMNRTTGNPGVPGMRLTNSSNSFAVKAGMTVMETMEALKAEVKVPISSVLTYVHAFIEEELIPVIQSSVNSDMQEVQTNPQHFALPTERGGNNQKISGSKIEGNPLSWATLCCARSAKPLFTYWLQLPQHRDMVVTILDRLIRGFASSAREELDALTWKLLANDDIYKKNASIGLKRDPFFVSYRQNLYNGYNSVDDMVNVATGGEVSKVTDSYISTGGRYSTGVSTACKCVGELEGWGVLWNLTGSGSLEGKKCFFSLLFTLSHLPILLDH